MIAPRVKRLPAKANLVSSVPRFGCDGQLIARPQREFRENKVLQLAVRPDEQLPLGLEALSRNHEVRNPGPRLRLCHDESGGCCDARSFFPAQRRQAYARLRQVEPNLLSGVAGFLDGGLHGACQRYRPGRAPGALGPRRPATRSRRSGWPLRCRGQDQPRPANHRALPGPSP
jgi:hypothetical protein